MVDDAECLKAAVEGVVAGAMTPFTTLVNDLFGGAAKEVGTQLTEFVKSYRRRRADRLLERASEFVEALAIEIRPVPPKIVIPIIEFASLEDDDSLQDRWAALLAREAGGEGLAGAIDVLRQLSSDDVELLQICYDHVHLMEIEERRQQDEHIRKHGSLMPIPSPFDPAKHSVDLALEMRKQQIVERLNHDWRHTGKYGAPSEFYTYRDNVARLGLLTSDGHITNFGYRFISVCQIPDSQR